jgi:hypothetical protein
MNSEAQRVIPARPLQVFSGTTTGTMHGTVMTKPSVTGGTTIINVPSRQGLSTPTSKDIEGAVYAYVRAMRALGHTRVRSENVSRALQISLSAAMAALQALEDKGVRRSK